MTDNTHEVTKTFRGAMIYDLMVASVHEEDPIIMGYCCIRLDRYMEALEKALDADTLAALQAEHSTKYKSPTEIAEEE